MRVKRYVPFKRNHSTIITPTQEDFVSQTGDLPRQMVVALVFIRRDDSILLVRQNYGRQFWSLPGGVVEPGESVDQAAVREVKEETGLAVQIKRVVGLYSKPAASALAITFEGTVIGGSLNPANEISECHYFPLDHLPARIRDHLRQRVEDFRRDLPHTVWRTQ
jgi:ADP-ribose pyrophosphatase YjhB (NUDIX family)